MLSCSHIVSSLVVFQPNWTTTPRRRTWEHFLLRHWNSGLLQEPVALSQEDGWIPQPVRKGAAGNEPWPSTSQPTTLLTGLYSFLSRYVFISRWRNACCTDLSSWHCLQILHACSEAAAWLGNTHTAGRPWPSLDVSLSLRPFVLSARTRNGTPHLPQHSVSRTCSRKTVVAHVLFANTRATALLLDGETGECISLHQHVRATCATHRASSSGYRRFYPQV
jgi:hypothetical protein